MLLPSPSRSVRKLLTVLALLAPFALRAEGPAKPAPDWREIATGSIIPSEGYADQPYVVINDDGSWVCLVTTSKSLEGARSTHVISSRSTDQGKTWSDPVPLEPSGPPESSYATVLRVPSGRIYAFYDHNTDNYSSFKSATGGVEKRVDEGGHFVFKFSDDGGRSWSPQRYEIPIRETEVDRKNVYGGKIRFFWHVGRPLVHQGAAYVTLHKIGEWGVHSFDLTEGNFLRSDNLLTERDPTKIHWETLPNGDVGLRAPAGPVAEEHSIVDLSDGSIYCTFRTVMGHPGMALSRDHGYTWTPPAYMVYGPGQRMVKTPRAANFVWNAGQGRYLYWFHNNGGNDFRNSRNPAWLIAGREVDTPAGKTLQWSEPEVVLYGEPEPADTRISISYPDFVVQNGRYFITETQKTIARVNEIPAPFLDRLWHQHELHEVAKDGLVADLKEAACAPGSTVAVPTDFDLTSDRGTGGLSLDLWVRLTDGAAGQTLVKAEDALGHGFALRTTDRGTLALELCGSKSAQAGSDYSVATATWECDPGVITPNQWHHVVATVDNGPRIMEFVVDGHFCDGGEARPFGWGRYPAELMHLTTPGTAQIAPALHGSIRHFRLYSRHLATSEAIGNGRADAAGAN